MGIEPTPKAWEAPVLPLNYARLRHFTPCLSQQLAQPYYPLQEASKSKSPALNANSYPSCLIYAEVKALPNPQAVLPLQCRGWDAFVAGLHISHSDQEGRS